MAAFGGKRSEGHAASHHKEMSARYDTELRTLLSAFPGGGKWVGTLCAVGSHLPSQMPSEGESKVRNRVQ